MHGKEWKGKFMHHHKKRASKNVTRCHTCKDCTTRKGPARAPLTPNKVGSQLQMVAMGIFLAHLWNLRRAIGTSLWWEIISQSICICSP